LTPINDRIKEYIVRSPYISNQPGQEPDGNPILYLGLWCAILNRVNGGLTSNEFNLVKETYLKSATLPGLLNRGEHKRKDFESHDDYIGMLAASVLTGNFDIVSEIYDYGKANRWQYDNTFNMPWYRTWFGRYAGMVQTIKLAHRVKLNLLDKILFYFGVAFNKGESGIQKAWLMSEIYREQPYRYWLCDKGLAVLDDKIWQYPGRMGGVFEIYFGTEHLFTKLMRGKA
jgi:hypothetical protein